LRLGATLAARRLLFGEKMAAGLADFDLATANTSLETRLWMNGGPVDNVTVANGEARSVPWTLDDVTIQLTFRERTA
jgi:hypothetical protein